MTLTDTRHQHADAKALEQWRNQNRPVRLPSYGGLSFWAIASRAALRACPECGSVLPPTAAIYVISETPEGGLACDCPAGRGGGVCWHVASVRHLRRYSFESLEDGPP